MQIVWNSLAHRKCCICALIITTPTASSVHGLHKALREVLSSRRNSHNKGNHLDPEQGLFQGESQDPCRTQWKEDWISYKHTGRERLNQF